jgi:murein DD-endopeptidase MepM/ murein hydrolase activator NlpD
MAVADIENRIKEGFPSRRWKGAPEATMTGWHAVIMMLVTMILAVLAPALVDASASFRAPLPSPSAKTADQTASNAGHEAEMLDFGAHVAFDRVLPGDTITQLLKRHSIPVQTAIQLNQEIVATFDLAARLKPGRPIKLALTEDRALAALAYPVGQRRTLRVTRRGDGSFIARVLPQPFARVSLYPYLAPAVESEEKLASGPKYDDAVLDDEAVLVLEGENEIAQNTQDNESSQDTSGAAQETSDNLLRQVVTQVRDGDSLSALLQRHRVSMRTSIALAETAKPHIDLDQQLRPGREVALVFDPKHRLLSFSYAAPNQTIKLTSNEGLTFNIAFLKADIEEERASLGIPTPSALKRKADDGKDDETDAAADELETPATFQQAANTVEETVRKGDNLAALLSRQNVPMGTTISMAKAARPVFDLARNLTPGKKLRLAFNADNRLMGLEYPLDLNRTFWLTREDVLKDFTPFIEKRSQDEQPPFKAIASVGTVKRKLDDQFQIVRGVIKNSFYMAARKAGLSRGQSMELIKLFEWNVDLARDIHPGDRFTVVIAQGGGSLPNGEIMSAELVNKKNQYRAVRYTSPKGITEYYDDQGLPVSKMLIQAPVDFTRISSHFSKKRKHPIFGYTRAHKGVDYAAPSGTPVRAAGHGQVTFVGRKGAFGKLVVVRHNDKYSTAYAHLSRYAKGLKAGSQIRQGEVLGRVGSTGASTGPHLHYEVRVFDKQVNPLSVRIPAGNPIPKSYMADFRSKSRPLLAMLSKSGNQTLAKLSSSD